MILIPPEDPRPWVMPPARGHACGQCLCGRPAGVARLQLATPALGNPALRRFPPDCRWMLCPHPIHSSHRVNLGGCYTQFVTDRRIAQKCAKGPVRSAEAVPGEFCCTDESRILENRGTHGEIVDEG